MNKYSVMGYSLNFPKSFEYDKNNLPYVKLDADLNNGKTFSYLNPKQSQIVAFENKNAVLEWAQKNLQIAIESLERKASQEANPEDQYLLGTMYHKGQGFLDQAIEWYKKCLADNWHQERYVASIMIGQLYLKIGEKEKDFSVKKIKFVMENTHLQFKDFQVPLLVDYGFGYNWGDAH